VVDKDKLRMAEEALLEDLLQEADEA